MRAAAAAVLAGLCLTLAGEARASDWLEQVGGLTARAGEAGAPLFVSTALAFSVGDRAYALAAESRIYPADSAAYAHELRIPGEPPLAARSVASDPGLGLALLELQAPSARVLAFRLPSVADAPVNVGARVRVRGLDAQGALSTELRGRLLSAASDRHAIPSLAGALEILGAPVGPTHVGAAVQAAEGGWLGLLSRQYLALRPGEPTHLGFWEPGDTGLQGHLVAIPARAAAAWATAALSGQLSARFRVSAEDRAAGRVRMTSGKLLLEEACPPAVAPGAPVDPNYPVGGGADGAGIGGQVSTGRACKLRVSLAPAPTAQFGVPAQQAWHDRVAADLLRGGLTAEAWYLTRRDFLTGHPERWTFGALEEFLRDASREELQVVTIYRQDGVGSAGVDPALRAAAAATGQLVARWLSDRTALVTHESGALARQVFFEMVVLQSEAHASIGAGDLEFLLDRQGGFKTAWATIEGFGSVGREIHPALARVRAELHE